jgi:hypothetical protein
MALHGTGGTELVTDCVSIYAWLFFITSSLEVGDMDGWDEGLGILIILPTFTDRALA